MLLKKLIFLITVFFLMGNTSVPPVQSNLPEYNLKAAFLYRFTDYVDWPNTNESQTFNIGVLGECPIINSLNEITRNKNVKSRPISIKKCEGLSEAMPCQILFIPLNTSYSIETVLSKINGRQVLIVTEQPGNASRGAHINFIVVESKLRFEVNLKSVTLSGLKLSSQLLQHAIIVDE
jgi:hypothetical protein